MDSLVFIFQPIMNSVVMTFIYFCFLNKMYEKKQINKFTFLGAYIVAVVITVSTVGFNQPVVNVLRSALLINALSFSLYKEKSKLVFVYNMIFVIMTIIADVMTVSLLATIEKESLSHILGDFEAMVISNLLYWICAFLGYKLLIFLFKKENRNEIQAKETILLFSVTFFEIAVIIYVVSFTKNSVQGGFLIFMLAGFLAFNIYSTRLIHMVAGISELKNELALSNQQSEIQLKHYQELMLKEDLSRKLSHDIKRHIQVMDDLYETGEISQAKAYKELLDKKVNSMGEGFQCSSLILSVIISHHLQKSKLNEIALKLDVEDVEIRFINDLDITTIFANLLDNAIDACMELDKNERTITLKMRKVNNYLVIDIFNPIKNAIVKVGEVFKTSKQNHSGIGLINVSNAVKKYNGEFSVDVENNIFLAKIAIPFPQKS